MPCAVSLKKSPIESNLYNQYPTSFPSSACCYLLPLVPTSLALVYWVFLPLDVFCSQCLTHCSLVVVPKAQLSALLPIELENKNQSSASLFCQQTTSELSDLIQQFFLLAVLWVRKLGRFHRGLFFFFYSHAVSHSGWDWRIYFQNDFFIQMPCLRLLEDGPAAFPSPCNVRAFHVVSPVGQSDFLHGHSGLPEPLMEVLLS